MIFSSLITNRGIPEEYNSSWVHNYNKCTCATNCQGSCEFSGSNRCANGTQVIMEAYMFKVDDFLINYLVSYLVSKKVNISSSSIVGYGCSSCGSSCTGGCTLSCEGTAQNRPQLVLIYITILKVYRHKVCSSILDETCLGTQVCDYIYP